MTVTIERAPAVSAHDVTREMGIQLGFAWHCTAGECDSNGCDRSEFTAHMRGHGAKALHPAVKPIRLRKSAPKATLPKLNVSPFKWLRWTESHAEPGTCECGHLSTVHRSIMGAWRDEPAITGGCDECDCTVERYDIRQVVTECERRGQFWASGSRPNSVWALPFESAPWEEGTAAPVLLSTKTPGRLEHLASGAHGREAVQRAENVRAHGSVFAVRTSYDGPVSLGAGGYHRTSTRTVHCDPACAATDGWKERDHQPYSLWAVVDVLTGRAQGMSADTLCPRCIHLDQPEVAELAASL